MKNFTQTDFEFIFDNSISIIEKIDFLNKAIDNQIIIKSNTIYEFDEKKRLYKKIDVANKMKITQLTLYLYTFLNKSYINLTSTAKELFTLKYKKMIYGLLNASLFPCKVIELLYRKISYNSTDIEFDDDKHGIHFSNGRYDLINGIFEERTREMFITYAVNYEYSKPSKIDVDFANKNIRKLFRDDESFHYMKRYLGSCFSGTFIKSQSFMLHYGIGGSGKSTIFKILSKIIGDYVKLLPTKTFESHNNPDKTLADIRLYNRFFVVEELTMKNQNRSLIKSFSDGLISTNKLYTDGSFQIKLHGVLNMISNHLMSHHNDSGMARRTNAYEYKNVFINENDKNEKRKINNKTIFKRDVDFNEKLSIGQKLGLFQIFANETKEFYAKNTLQLPKAFVDGKNEIIESNDVWADFITNNLKLTPDDLGNYIMKKDMCDLVNNSFEFSTSKNIGYSIILRELKSRGIEYNKAKMKHGRKGIFEGMVINKQETLKKISKDKYQGRYNPYYFFNLGDQGMYLFFLQFRAIETEKMSIEEQIIIKQTMKGGIRYMYSKNTTLKKGYSYDIN